MKEGYKYECFIYNISKKINNVDTQMCVGVFILLKMLIIAINTFQKSYIHLLNEVYKRNVLVHTNRINYSKIVECNTTSSLKNYFLILTIKYLKKKEEKK